MGNPYKKKIKGVEVDIYDILQAYDVRNPAIQHAIKKLLCPGQRSGGKSMIRDFEEARWSVNRGIELERPLVKVTVRED